MEAAAEQRSMLEQEGLGCQTQHSHLCRFLWETRSIAFCILNLTCSSHIELSCKARVEPGAISVLALSWVGDPSTIENCGKGSVGCNGL